MKRNRGFTLLELMIVVAIVAIIAAFAITSYSENVRKGKRTGGVRAILEYQMALEKWRAGCPSYADDTAGTNNCKDRNGDGDGADAGVDATYPSVPVSDYYTLTLSNLSPTRYTITAAGRRALRAWLTQPGAGPELEFEQLVKIHFADSGTKHDILANLAATIAWVREQNIEHLATARAVLAGQSPFPQRDAVNHLGGRFLTSYYTMVAEWAEWATSVVRTWPENPTEAEPEPEVIREIVRAAEALEARTAPGQPAGSGGRHGD